MDSSVMLDILGVEHTNKDGYSDLPCLFGFLNHTGKDNTKFTARIDTDCSNYVCFRCRTSIAKYAGWTSPDDMLMKLRNLYEEKGLDNTRIKAALDYVRTNKVPSNITPMVYIPTESKSSIVYFPKTYLNRYPSVLRKSKSNHYIHQEVIDYLANRRVPMQVVIDFDIRYDFKFKRVLLPSYTNGQVLVALKGRNIHYNPDIGGNVKYYIYQHTPDAKNIPFRCNSETLFLRHYQLDKKKPLVLVEGEFDAIRVYQSYRNVTCIGGLNITEKKLEFLKKFKDIIYIPDNDEKGLANVPKIIKLLPKVKVVTLPEPYKDGGAMPALQMRELLVHHLDLDPQLLTNLEAKALALETV